jgi:hypothetical protein
MQSSETPFLTSFRFLLFIMVLLLIYVSTKQSSRAFEKAWRLPIIYPNGCEDFNRKMTERQSLMRSLSMKWSLFTVFDYSLGVLIAYELVMGFSAAGHGIDYYFGMHLPSAVVVSFGVGSLLAMASIKLRNPFQSGKIQPLNHLVKNLDSLVNAVHVGDVEVSEDTEDILLRIIREEIERFIENRKLGDAECGRLLEYLAGIGGTVGQAASSLLWPI